MKPSSLELGWHVGKAAERVCPCQLSPESIGVLLGKDGPEGVNKGKGVNKEHSLIHSHVCMHSHIYLNALTCIGTW